MHVRATILFAVIWLWVWGRVSRKLCERYFGQKQTNTGEDLTTGATATSASILSSLGKISFSNTIMRKVWIGIKPIIQFILLTFNALLYLRPPPYSPKFIATTLVLYLLESYGCSTRRYLSRAMNAPTELTEFLESLRSVDPVVKWKVRCFHYEVREMWKLILSSGGLLRTLYGWICSRNDDDQRTIEIDNGIDKHKFGSSPSWMTKKVVTHQAVGSYKFGRWDFSIYLFFVSIHTCINQNDLVVKILLWQHYGSELNPSHLLMKHPLVSWLYQSCLFWRIERLGKIILPSRLHLWC